MRKPMTKAQRAKIGQAVKRAIAAKKVPTKKFMSPLEQPTQRYEVIITCSSAEVAELIALLGRDDVADSLSLRVRRVIA